MTAAIVIFSVCCVLLVLTVLIKPDVKIGKVHFPLYPLVAVIGAVFAILLTPLTMRAVGEGMIGAGAVNPIKILTLFISVTAISVFLDEAGFFEYMAIKVLKKAGTSQIKLFFLLYATVSVLTVFTSNDIVILTFTPFIIYFCKSADIDPVPFLVAEFTAANTWSMALIIGNPTNVYLATAAGIGFVDYIKVMAAPAVLTGIAALGILLAIFFRRLKTPIAEVTTQEVAVDRPQCILGLTVLGVCTVSLAVSGYIGVEMWLECAICAGVLVLSALLICLVRHKKPVILGHALLRVPYGLIPFVLAMFVISLSLGVTGVTEKVAAGLSSHELLLYGTTSFFASNLVNNIPMSVIYSSMLTAGGAGEAAVFASIIGSNLGALLTPVGALAGIMFSSITKKHGVRFPALRFIMYGSIVSAVVMPVALLSLLMMV